MTIVNIVGGGLYGAVTALLVAKQEGKQKRVRVIDSAQELLSSFSSIVLADTALNNGFHGIEIPRADGLVAFLRDQVGVPVELKPNHRFLSINGEMVSFDTVFADWPDRAKQLIAAPLTQDAKSIDQLLDCLSPDGLALIKANARRYGDVFEHVQHLMVPWFLPADFALASNDEGAVFRSGVRSRDIIPQYVVPRGGLFSNLQAYFLKKFADHNIELVSGVKMVPGDHGLTYESKTQDVSFLQNADETIFAMSSATLLTRLAPELTKELTKVSRRAFNALYVASSQTKHLTNISEILSLSETAPQFGRLSFPMANAVDDRCLIQAEIFLDDRADMEDPSYFDPRHVESICALEHRSVKLLDYKQTRKIFSPNPDTIKAAEIAILDWASRCRETLHIEAYFSPINMSKIYLLAKDMAERIK